jgi:hypothetical protein
MDIVFFERWHFWFFRNVGYRANPGEGKRLFFGWLCAAGQNSGIMTGFLSGAYQKHIP